ncbi:MAG TPA: F0F1 ATP synthase subunit delta [Candidatus Omnitrophota bacterium]|nr:F0F1 ATP synthase subunit delta [Candidatus Omnitrophota bacterium]HRZ14480.1 F0F1 ATP synthase subunit delta [Candidatus Omnitrophota bacterium]
MNILIPMLVVLVVLFFIMMHFMSKMIKGDVVSATAHLDQQAQEYAKKDADLAKKFEELKRQGQEIVANAQKEAQQKSEELLKEAAQEKEKVIAAAHLQADEVIKQADAARLALLADMDKKVDERAVVKAVELLSQSLPESVRSHMHERWVADLIGTSFEQLDRLKIPGDVHIAEVVSAFALSPEQREMLAAKLSEKIGRQMEVQEKVDPAIIAGLIVTIGSLFFDGSVRFKIQEVARAE